MFRKILLALLFTGCVLEPSFAEQVSWAKARWELATCRSPRYYTLSVVDHIENCPGPAPLGFQWYGCYEPSSGALSISREIPHESGLLLKVLTHEMGHSIHPGVHADPGVGIMSARMSQATPTITEADIELICEEYDCPCRRPEIP